MCIAGGSIRFGHAPHILAWSIVTLRLSFLNPRKTMSLPIEVVRTWVISGREPESISPKSDWRENLTISSALIAFASPLGAEASTVIFWIVIGSVASAATAANERSAIFFILIIL